MRDETSETDGDADWEAATRALVESPDAAAEPEPLSAETQAEIIARAFARRRAAAEPVNRAGARVHRLRRGPLLAATLAAAAAAAIVGLREPADIGPITLDATVTRALMRGRTPGETAGDRPVLDVRNEPGWTVRLSAGATSARLQLYVIAFAEREGPSLLRATSERRDDAFRVLGEVGALGLRPGDVTLYFVVGPEGADREALAQAEALHAGASLARGWAAERRDLRIVGS